MPKVDIQFSNSLHPSCQALGRVDAGTAEIQTCPKADLVCQGRIASSQRNSECVGHKLPLLETHETLGQLDTSLGTYALAFILLQFIDSSKNSNGIAGSRSSDMLFRCQVMSRFVFMGPSCFDHFMSTEGRGIVKLTSYSFYGMKSYDCYDLSQSALKPECCKTSKRLCSHGSLVDGSWSACQ